MKAPAWLTTKDKPVSCRGGITACIIISSAIFAGGYAAGQANADVEKPEPFRGAQEFCLNYQESFSFMSPDEAVVICKNAGLQEDDLGRNWRQD